MKSALLKSSLWALVGAALYISNRPSHKASKQDKRLKKDVMSFMTKYAIPFILCTSVVMSAAEILTVHSSSFRNMTSYPSVCDATTVETSSLVYFAVIMFSFLLRLYSFRELGDLFTYDVTIRPNHTLITGGPYHYVRHPSYTALFGVWIGNAMLHFSACDSVLVQCVFWPWFVVVSVCTVKLVSRSGDEDEILHETFGAEWEAYRRRVPCRFVPGVL